MDEQESVPALRLVIPLPIALYSAKGLLFELYEGGQPLAASPHCLEKSENHRGAGIHWSLLGCFRELPRRLICNQPGFVSRR